ncbi:GRP family sugar transporter [Secundilactobacillus collinoides]|uniref:GRP family sugar transporter n=1 Tax=Secundilactobacillus collinoides TaxID=33960 RepID=UPI000AC0C24F|nr:GRP family sugar transporter [Secundilactobacillus collinoides]
MGVLIGLVPALFLGHLPGMDEKGHWWEFFLEQLLGTSGGILIAAGAVALWLQQGVSPHDFLLYFLSGFLWNIGQIGQCWSFMRLGVSAVMPVTTALQVIGNSLVGAWLFGEWQGWQTNLLGLAALIVIVLCVFISNGALHIAKEEALVYVILLVTSIGYWCYSGFPHYVTNPNGLAGFLPQALGMFSGSLLIYLIGRHRLQHQTRGACEISRPASSSRWPRGRISFHCN